MKALWLGIFCCLDVVSGVALKYPRRSVQWPRPYGGYLKESKSSRICVDSRVMMTSMEGVLEVNADVVVTAYRSMLSEIRLGSGHLKCPAEDGFWLKYIEVTVTEDAVLGPGVNESYSMSVVDDVLEIRALTSFGARHGMVTLHNLLQVENTRPVSAMKNGAAIRSEVAEDFYYFLPFELSSFKIEDRPRLSHRGLMIDTGSNFVRSGILKRILDVMARAKFNVFHWHATDKFSTSIYTSVAGELIHGYLGFGAASSKWEIYRPEKIVEIIQYAYNRGIRTIMEVDGPANVYSWRNGPRSLQVNCMTSDYQSLEYCDRPPCHVMSLGDFLLSTMDAFAVDLNALVKPREHYHAGYHNYDFNCSALSETAERQLMRGWQIQLPRFEAWDRKVIVWSSSQLRETAHQLQEEGHSKDYFSREKFILQFENIYTEKNITVPDQLSRAQQALDDGYDVILSANPLNCGFEHSWDYTRPDICPYTLWWDLYKTSPDLQLSQDKANVLGVEALMYTYYSDSDTIESFLWPRAVALAGALWEQRDSLPADPTDQTTIDLAYQAFFQMNHFHDMIFNIAPIPFTPLTNRWCINDDEQVCKQFASCIYKGC